MGKHTKKAYFTLASSRSNGVTSKYAFPYFNTLARLYEGNL
ncbi:hypothetical protein LAP9571_02262 [Lactiplantibacillus plantarum]|nr:hypothetical protein LAP9571_02262 [Lactiplantibacillus plantarum]VFI61576.1 hypothetical protein LAP9492_02262 [Lactiplantibacillus plantarum]